MRAGSPHHVAGDHPPIIQWGQAHPLIPACLCTARRVLTGKGDELVVTTTPNQDNPLMGNLPSTPEVKSAGCTPILGLDIWEHAYYLK